MLRAILSYPMINYLPRYFSRMRDNYAALNTVDACRDIMRENAAELSDAEREKYDRALIHIELSAYDGLNMWQEYISLFDEVRKSKMYTVEYVAAANHPDMDKYLLYERDGKKYLHFLFISNNRYNIICRKQQRAGAGKNVEHLKRHQQSQLSDESLESRYAELKHLFEFLCRQRL